MPIGSTGSALCTAIGVPVPKITWSNDGHSIQGVRILSSEQGELLIKGVIFGGSLRQPVHE